MPNYSPISPGPLNGKKLIEVSHMLMGPYCGMLLADLGMEVIKIEPPDGDIARTLGPHNIDGHNAYFVSLNRNKKSITLDLTTDEGRKKFHTLVAQADGLITNLRPGAINSLGLTYDKLKHINPKIACVAMTGFGLDSIESERPAYDYIIQALVGIMDLTGEPDGYPTKAGYSAVDNSAGIMGALGLLARIIEGKGGQVDIAMHDVMLSQLNYLAGAWLNAQEKPVRQSLSAHPYIVPAQVFASADGWLTLFITHDNFWNKFCEIINNPEWITDERFCTMKKRGEHRVSLIPLLNEVMKTKTSNEWEALLIPLGIVVAGIKNLSEAISSPLTKDREMVIKLKDEETNFLAIGNPIKNIGHKTAYNISPKLNQDPNAQFES